MTLPKRGESSGLLDTCVMPDRPIAASIGSTDKTVARSRRPSSSASALLPDPGSPLRTTNVPSILVAAGADRGAMPYFPEAVARTGESEAALGGYGWLREEGEDVALGIEQLVVASHGRSEGGTRICAPAAAARA